MTIAILCGGSGTRLWPLSSELMPKQFVSLLNDTSLFQQTISRNLPFSDVFCIVTNDKHYFLALDEIDKMNTKGTHFRYVLESVSKDTAAALFFVALQCQKDEVILALPSDHIIKDDNLYAEAISQAREAASSLRFRASRRAIIAISIKNCEIISFKVLMRKKL